MRLNPGNKQLKVFVQTRFNKQVTLQDIRNLKKKVKIGEGLTDVEQLTELLEEIEGKGKVDISIDENGAIMMIAFATNEMMQMYLQYPEIIFMDGTYKINKYSYPLYMILIQDNLGSCRAVFYTFLRSETADMMNSLIASFCKMMEDVSKTETVMLDKYQNEIQAVRTALPIATILLCKFHVLKYFKKKVSDLVRPVGDKNEIFATVKQLVYANSEESFQSCLRTLENQDNDLFQYVSHNWLGCKEMWATYLRSSKLTFGNDTNNHIELENGKLKHLLSSATSMSKCIRNIIFHNSVLNDFCKSILQWYMEKMIHCLVSCIVSTQSMQ